jgi:hypothetical protein
MKKWMLPLLCVSLAGCALGGHHEATETPPLSAEQITLLRQNDLLQAKLLVLGGSEEQLKLADALLLRNGGSSADGEVEFYRAVIAIKQGPQTDDVLELLNASADRHYPLAYALLYRMYTDPFLVPEADPIQAQTYKSAYGDLPVARSGYPSFDKAVEVTRQLAP